MPPRACLRDKSWKPREDSTVADSDLSPDDYRRAAALMTHRAAATGEHLYEGVRAIVEEAQDEGRLTRLLVALDTGYRGWISHLRAGRSPEWIDELIDDTAENHEDRYTRLAARAIVSIRTGDDERFMNVVNEANADPANDGGGRLTGAVSDVYQFLLPELATPGGREALRAWTIEIAKGPGSAEL